MAALFAFLHHVAAFTLVSAFAIEFVLIRQELSRLKEGRAPAVSAKRQRTIRSVLHVELAAVVLLVLNAALMARGIGYAG
jgi:putative membrane protein